MYEWNEMVQLMIDWVEEDLAASPTLLKMSEQLGYSPYYCTKQFHALTGMTLRDYIWQRRIGRAALELRDTDTRILDIAVKFGFSSQEAFSRAFCRAFKVTPHAYRKAPRPIPLAIRAEVFSPYQYLIRERDKMRQVHLQEAEIKLEFIPAHKFIGIRDIGSTNYGGFWRTGMIVMRSPERWRACRITRFPASWARRQAGSMRMGTRATCMAFLLQPITVGIFLRGWSAAMCRNRNIWSFSSAV